MTDEYLDCVGLPLSQGKHTLLDTEDYEKLKECTAFYSAKYSNGQKLGTGYAFVTVNGVEERLHRYVIQAAPGMLVDHINRDTLDNRKANLRECTPAQNTRNRARGRPDRRSRFKGLEFNPRLGKWRASIIVNGVRIRLGHFKDETDAALAYNAAAIKHHGAFAFLNIVEARQ